jgi:hypothetical protein
MSNQAYGQTGFPEQRLRRAEGEEAQMGAVHYPGIRSRNARRAVPVVDPSKQYWAEKPLFSPQVLENVGKTVAQIRDRAYVLRHRQKE